MYTPYIKVELEKLKNNVRKLKGELDPRGIEIAFVTKGFCANTEIIKAMREEGITLFADSRMKNIMRVKKELGDIKYLLIRVPKLSEIEEVVSFTDMSLQSQVEVIQAISEEAIRQKKIHQIILMIDVGDLREGILEKDLDETAEFIKKCQGVELIGIGTNVGCYGSIMPSIENTEVLVKIKQRLIDKHGFAIQVISGGSTCGLKLVEQEQMHEEINLLRIGEAILFGEDSTNDRYLDGFYQDAFTLHAEVVELKEKPSVPIGTMGKDAFGQTNEYMDYGIRWRAILAVGRQDMNIDAIIPVDKNIRIIGASSDHMIVDVTDCIDTVSIGTVLSFRCAYTAVLAGTTSAYVDLHMV